VTPMDECDGGDEHTRKSHALNNFFDRTESKSSHSHDFAWMCRLCKATGHQTYKFMAHCDACHFTNMDLMKTVADYRFKYGRARKKQKGASESDRQSDSSTTSSTAPQFTQSFLRDCPAIKTDTDAKTKANVLVSQLVVSKMLPLDFFDSKDVREFVREIGLIAIQEYKRRPGAKVYGIDISQLIQSRRELRSKWLPLTCNALTQSAVTSILKLATVQGCTLLQVCVCTSLCISTTLCNLTSSLFSNTSMAGWPLKHQP
jgi:hypothetical protein